MKLPSDFRFRTNWRGKLILQKKHIYRDRFGDLYYDWKDATIEDIKVLFE